jgi:aryl-alcohol dehydrogenase-like predicted oxidoreductase
MTSVQLCLGTAQFGLNYGITNDAGQVPQDDVKNILSLSERSSVSFLDTAQSYGNAEIVLGSCLCSNHSFRIISKLPAQNSLPFNTSSVDKWEESFFQTLDNLNSTQIDTFMLHRAADILRDDSFVLMDWLNSLLQRSLVRRLGLSIYSSRDLDLVPIECFHVVQLPLSLYDQRFIQDGTIKLLKRSNVAIHARSVFLQGLLLTPAVDWPDWIEVGFRDHHSKLESFADDHSLNLLQLSLGFIQSCSDLESVVLGVTSYAELSSILSVWNSAFDVWSYGDPHMWSWSNHDNLDPRSWPS